MTIARHYLFTINLLTAFQAACAFETPPLTFPAKLTVIEEAVARISHTNPSLTNTLGTGFLVSEDGLILTADHIVIDPSTGKLRATLFASILTIHGEVRSTLTLVKRMRAGRTGRDVALLRLTDPPPRPLKFLKIGPFPTATREITIVGFPKIFESGVKPFAIHRSGTIASTNFTMDQDQILMLDVRGLEGFSGSPVIIGKDLSVVGVFFGHPRNNENSDFSIAFPVIPDDILTPNQ